MSEKKTLSVAVLGLGRFGKFTAKELFENGVELLIADKSEDVVNQLSDIAEVAVACDLSDPDAVEKLGLGNMDAVIVCMGSSMDPSITCIMVAKEQGVHKVIAKAGSERMGKVLKKIGADEIVYPEKTMAQLTVTKVLGR